MKTINTNALAALSQMPNTDFLLEVFRDERTAGLFLPGDVGRHLKGEFELADALAIEVARQLSDDGGVPLIEALRFVSYTGAVDRFASYRNSESHENRSRQKESSDFWMGVVFARATWGNEPRGSWPVTEFGPGECWHRMHFAGPLDWVFPQMREWMKHDEQESPDSDPARIFLSNVSTAERRLRKRAAELGIALD